MNKVRLKMLERTNERPAVKCGGRLITGQKGRLCNLLFNLLILVVVSPDNYVIYAPIFLGLCNKLDLDIDVFLGFDSMEWEIRLLYHISTLAFKFLMKIEPSLPWLN